MAPYLDALRSEIELWGSGPGRTRSSRRCSSEAARHPTWLTGSLGMLIDAVRGAFGLAGRRGDYGRG